ncbi:uncharacterized protein LOC143424258 [Xylocopa sonorina]|uniref:uncharacterized protein LOC143424258 n=1 Tax=Xylocopa sonorina TaxID=1818115 RepID=UPI00403A8378
MKFMIFLFIFVSVLFINDVSGKFSVGKFKLSSGRSRGGSNGRFSSGRSTSSQRITVHKPFGSGSPTRSSTGSSDALQNKNINTNFLHAEGGGARRPSKPIEPSYAPSAPPIGGKPRVITESKQTSGIQPSAPQEHITRTSTGTLQNRGTGNK